jgi:WD40 repeat protein
MNIPKILFAFSAFSISSFLIAMDSIKEVTPESWEKHGTFHSHKKPDYSFLRCNGDGFIWMRELNSLRSQCLQMIQHNVDDPKVSIITDFFFHEREKPIVRSLHISPNQKFIVAALDKNLIIFELFKSSDGYNINEKRKLCFNTPITTLATQPDNRNMLIGNQDGTLTLVGYESDLTELPKVHTNSITEIAFCPNCKTFVSCDSAGALYLWKKNATFHYRQLPFTKSVTKCRIINGLVALQHVSEDNQDQEVSLFNIKTNTLKETYKGNLIAMNEYNETFIQDQNNLIQIKTNGSLENYQLPNDVVLIGNQTYSADNPLFLALKTSQQKDEKTSDIFYKTEFFIPKK